jgi:hypothetical protein
MGTLGQGGKRVGAIRLFEYLRRAQPSSPCSGFPSSTARSTGSHVSPPLQSLSCAFAGLPSTSPESRHAKASSLIIRERRSPQRAGALFSKAPETSDNPKSPLATPKNRRINQPSDEPRPPLNHAAFCLKYSDDGHPRPLRLAQEWGVTRPELGPVLNGPHPIFSCLSHKGIRQAPSL